MRFAERALELTRALRQGSSRDGVVDVGAIATPLQLDVIEKLVASAVKQGARLLCGGKRVHAEQGNFFEPTILADVTPEMDIAREELFGPVMLLMRVTRRRRGGARRQRRVLRPVVVGVLEEIARARARSRRSSKPA